MAYLPFASYLGGRWLPIDAFQTLVRRAGGTQTLSSPSTVSARELPAHHLVGIRGLQGRGSLLGHMILIINPTPFPTLREQYVESPLV